MNKYAINVKFLTQDGKRDEVIDILMETTKLLKGAKGLHLYMVSKSADNENRVVITELWDTKEDHDNSLKIEGVRDLINKAAPLWNMSEKDAISKTEMIVQGGIGVPN